MNDGDSGLSQNTRSAAEEEGLVLLLLCSALLLNLNTALGWSEAFDPRKGQRRAFRKQTFGLSTTEDQLSTDETFESR